MDPLIKYTELNVREDSLKKFGKTKHLLHIFSVSCLISRPSCYYALEGNRACLNFANPTCNCRVGRIIRITIISKTGIE